MNSHVRPHAIIPEERLVVEGFPASRTHVDPSRRGGGHQDIHAKRAGRVRVGAPSNLERERVYATIRRLRQQRSTEHGHERSVRRLADVPRPLAFAIDSDQVWEQRIALKHHPHAAPVSRKLEEVLAPDPHLARIGRLEAGDHSESSRLPAAGGTEERDELLAGFQVFTTGRFWVSTEVDEPSQRQIGLWRR
jgi:hypothetical protein